MRIPNSCAILQDSILQTGVCASRSSHTDLANRGVRQSVQPHTSYAQLLVFDKTSAQPHFAVVNCSDAVMSVFYAPVLTHSLIFLQLWTAVS